MSDADDAEMVSQSFEDVEVSIPAGPGGESKFVKWTTGKLEIRDLVVLLHLPGVPKSLGCLSRASAVPQDKTGRSLDVKMGKSGVGAALYRLVFKSSREAVLVAELAEQAMKDEFAEWEAVDTAHKATTKALLAEVKNSLSGRRPMLYEGVQLIGPDPNGEEGSEVLLGEGILGLMDPNWRDGVDVSHLAAKRDIGEYEIVFYSEEVGASKPVMRLPVGPKMSLKEQPRQKAELDDEEEPAKTLLLTMREGPVLTLTFETIEVADSFERDFEVRQRLMDVGFMTAMNQRELGQLKLAGRRSPFERAAHLVLLVPAAILVVAVKSPWVAEGLLQFLLPDFCVVPCHKVIEGA